MCEGLGSVVGIFRVGGVSSRAAQGLFPYPRLPRPPKHLDASGAAHTPANPQACKNKSLNPKAAKPGRLWATWLPSSISVP